MGAVTPKHTLALQYYLYDGSLRALPDAYGARLSDMAAACDCNQAEALAALLWLKSCGYVAVVRHFPLTDDIFFEIAGVRRPPGTQLFRMGFPEARLSHDAEGTTDTDREWLRRLFE